MANKPISDPRHTRPNYIIYVQNRVQNLSGFMILCRSANDWNSSFVFLYATPVQVTCTGSSKCPGYSLYRQESLASFQEQVTPSGRPGKYEHASKLSSVPAHCIVLMTKGSVPDVPYPAAAAFPLVSATAPDQGRPSCLHATWAVTVTQEL